MYYLFTCFSAAHRKAILLLCMVMISALTVFGSHVSGGEFTVVDLGNNQYQVTFTSYLNCNTANNLGAVNVRIFNNSTNTVSTLALNQISRNDLPMISPCPSNPNGVCITRIVTSANVTLPANANGYTIYYSSSARSSGIQNILNSNSSGFAYYANIPSSISFPGNRTPIFNNLPSPSICIGIPLQLDMSASDPDGDSLAYSFISPLSSISGSGPLTFTPINFAGNSTQTDPTGSGLTINPVTGIVSGVQNNIGLYSIAVLVQEFRNGIQIGQMMRDFVYNFQACPITQIPLFDINGNSLGINGTINQCDSTVSIVLDAQQIANNLNNFVWNSGRVGRYDTATFATRGVYVVGGRDASSCLFSGRATVNYSPINARISGVDTFCVNQPSVLTANSSVTNGSMYKWNGVVGSTTFTPMNSGPVILEVQNGQCSVYDTVHVKVNNLPVIDLGSDTTLCNGAPFNVTINRTGVSYLWDDGGTSNVRNIVSTGKYFVRVTNDTSQCVYRDTLDVTNTILNVSISGDTNFCEGESALLMAIVNQNSGNQYLWSNASTLNSTSVATPGLVWVEINNNGCKVRDSSVVIVNKLPQFSLGNDTSICNSAVVNMAISKPGVNILWDDMTTGANRILSTSGTYFAKLTDVSTGCVFSDTIKVNHMNLSASISGDTSLCLGESTILYVNTNQVSGNQYLWPDNSTDSTFTTSNYGDVLVKVKNQHCTVYASRFVSVFPLPGFSLGNDTVLCVGNSLSLILNHPNSSYLWNDLSTSNAKTISTAGIYSVKLTNNTSTCFFSDSIDVAYNSYFDLIPNDSVFLCRNSQHTIDLSGMGASYNWPELATNNPVVSIASKGLFHVNVQDAYGCPQKDSIIIEVDALTLDLGNDTLVCAKDSVYLDAGSAANYSWLPIARNSRYYSAGTSGDVMLTITNNNGCDQRDTIAITVEQLPVFSLGPDQELCAGQVATLSPNLGNAYTYLWNDLSTNEVLKGHNDGVYWVEATSINNCKSRDSVQLTFYAYPIVQLGADRILCDNNTITLAVNVNPLHTIQWSTGSTSDSLIVSAAGIYSVEIFNEIGCSVTDQVSISAMNTPTYNYFELPVACDFKQITLSAVAAKDAEYIWNTTSKDNFISVSDTGVFFVNKKNYCGSALDSFVVKFKEQCDCSVFTPNCFTPNNDGINDYFKPTFSCNFYDYELSIFNRWGEKVFTSNNSDDYWNGTTRSGKIAQQDVYVYLITYKAWNNRDLQTKQESGVVTLLK